jgi:LysM repeat protein
MADIAVPGPAALSTAPDTAAVCPYLLAVDSAWRSSTVSRDHRCHAVAPAAALAADKQRRLCLVSAHGGCATYLAATMALEEGGSVEERPLHRSVTKTAPLVLDRGRLPMARLPMAFPALPHRAGQGGLVALMVVAFGALAVTRLGDGGPGVTPVGGVSGASPTAAAVATATPADATTAPASPEAPTRTLVPSGVEPTAAPPPTPTPASSPTPAPTARPSPAAAKTYTVQSGDTLSGIAGEHGTTWQILAELNDIQNPRQLRVGQVIKLPG